MKTSIETKFGLNQKVFVLNDNKITETKIIRINVKIQEKTEIKADFLPPEPTGREEFLITYDLSERYKYLYNIDEETIFASKEELIASL